MLAFYLSLLDTEEQRDKLEQIYTRYRGLMFHVLQVYFMTNIWQKMLYMKLF